MPKIPLDSKEVIPTVVNLKYVEFIEKREKTTTIHFHGTQFSYSKEFQNAHHDISYINSESAQQVNAINNRPWEL